MNDIHLLIIPTVMIPLTAISVALTIVASFIAGLFGIQLKAEGPKKLLEVLLKPKVLASALVLNVVVLAGMWAYDYVKNLPKFISTIESKMEELGKPSDKEYADNLRFNQYFTKKNPTIRNVQIREKWNLNIGSGAFRGPVVSGTSAFIGTIDGHIHEIDIVNGEKLRSFYVGTFVSPAPVIFNGYMYVGEGSHYTHHARVYKFSLKEGKLVDSYTTKGHTEGQTTIHSHDGKTLIFAVAGKDGVHAIYPDSMEARWTQNIGHIDAAVNAKDGRVFIGTGREKGDSSKHRSWAAALDFDDGKVLWKRELPASSWMVPLVRSTDVCYIYGEVYFKSGLGGLNCYKQEDGEPTMAVNLAEPLASMPIQLDNDILLATIKGTVCRYHGEDGRIKWCRQSAAPLKGTSFTTPTFDQELGVILYPNRDLGLELLDPLTGEVVGSWGDGWKIQHASANPTQWGYVIGDGKGRVHLLEARALPLASGDSDTTEL